MGLFDKKYNTNTSTTNYSTVEDLSGNEGNLIYGNNNTIQRLDGEIVSAALSSVDKAVSENSDKFSTLIDAGGRMFGGALAFAGDNTAILKDVVKEALSFSAGTYETSTNAVLKSVDNSYSFSAGALQTTIASMDMNNARAAQMSNKAIDAVTQSAKDQLAHLEKSTDSALSYNAGLVTKAIDTVTKNAASTNATATQLVNAGIASVKDASKSATETLATSLSENNAKVIKVVAIAVAVGLVAVFAFKGR